MTAPSRLYVDTNVFVYLFEGSDELSAALAELFLREPISPSPFLATSELTLAELIVIPCRENNTKLIDRYDSWTMSNPYLEVGPIDRSVLWAAAVLRARYGNLKLPDAIHLATALRFGCSHFLTADLGLSGEYELFHHHWGITLGPATIAVVRPSLGYVRAAAEGSI